MSDAYDDDIIDVPPLSAGPERPRAARVSALECMNAWPGRICTGPVDYRASLTGTDTPMIRCEGHHREALDRKAGIDRRYPDRAPSDFDPFYAGESWDGDQ